jgi:RNA polymerase sigma-70 factor (ECF subfamily)
MERDLVVRARAGDHDAFGELTSAMIPHLKPIAWLILRDPERAADAVQNALVRAWRELPTLRDPDRFDAWMRRLLVRACIDEARRLRRHRFDTTIDAIIPPTVPDASASIADRDLLERAFRRLDADARALIVLHHYLDLPLAEVAATLRIPLGTAKSRLHRSLRAMRAAIDADARPGTDIAEGRPA